MKIFLAGQVGFYNRGCEALVRVLVLELTRCLGPSSFVIPSNDISTDRMRWPEAEGLGVEFIPFEPIPETIRWWDRVVRHAGKLAEFWWPLPEPGARIASEIASSDLVVVTGGDILSLDYQGASLLRWVAQIEAALHRQIPVVLWSSSVGPFSAWPAVERRMVGHLSRYLLLSTREGHSQNYMASLGILKSVQTADPAFLLQPQDVDLKSLMPASAIQGCGVLGFNVSPVLARSRARHGSLEQLESEIIAFWRHAIRERGLGVLLVPHVDSPDGMSDQSDSGYMRALLARAPDLLPHIKILPPVFNAAQLKAILGACRFFIGARTHATIGALSSGVPTVSIAYSVKAKGINHDLFGHLEYVLETPSTSLRTLVEALAGLERNETEIRAHLERRIPEVKAQARRTGALIAEALQCSPSLLDA